MIQRPLVTPTGRRRSFRAVLKHEQPSVERWRIAGSGVMGEPTDAPNTEAVVEALRANGVEVRFYSLGSSAGVDSHHLEARFLDGGLHAQTGSYWYGKKGAWIDGPEAVKWVGQLLDLG